MIRTRADDSAALLCQAECIGTRAKSLLALPGFSGRVAAALADVAYLTGRDGEVLWLFWEAVPLHGRGIGLSFPPDCLRSGQPFRVEGQDLAVGGRLVIALGRAREWTPASPGPGDVEPLAGLQEAARRLLGALCPAIGPGEPGGVMRGLASLCTGGDGAPCPCEARQLPFLAPVFDLMGQCLSGGLTGIESRARELIGLGPGLTPCGDDFLGGLLFAASWLRNAYPGNPGVAAQPTGALVRWAHNRTHPVSHAILADLADGQGPEPLHALLWLLASGEERGGRTIAAADRLARIGTTTGWYILAGVLTWLLSVDA